MKPSRVATLLVFALLMCSCATQPAPDSEDVPGFLLGVWHGFITLFSLIGSLFRHVRIYAYPNSGFWYDVGFMFGMSVWATAIGGSRRRRHFHQR